MKDWSLILNLYFGSAVVNLVLLSGVSFLWTKSNGDMESPLIWFIIFSVLYIGLYGVLVQLKKWVYNSEEETGIVGGLMDSDMVEKKTV